jgi:putative flippase GtrA
MIDGPARAARVLLSRSRRIVVYIGIGAISFAVDFGCLVALHELAGAPVWLAATTGYWSSVVVNYALNRTVAFRDRTPPATSVARYGLLLGVNWLATLAIITTADALGLGYLVGKVAAVLVLTTLNYVAYSRWVFADLSPGAPGEDVHDVAGTTVVEHRGGDERPGYTGDRQD